MSHPLEDALAWVSDKRRELPNRRDLSQLKRALMVTVAIESADDPEPDPAPEPTPEPIPEPPAEEADVLPLSSDTTEK